MTDVSPAANAAEKLATPQGREEAKSEARASASEAAGRAQHVAEDARRRAAEGAAAARDWAADQSDVLRDTVQTKPFISIGVSAASAFAAGLIVGVLLTRD